MNGLVSGAFLKDAVELLVRLVESAGRGRRTRRESTTRFIHSCTSLTRLTRGAP